MHGDVAEERVERVAAELLGEEAGPPGRVDDRAHAHRVLRALRVGVAERDPGRVEGRVQGAMLLAHGHPALLRVAEQDVVERRAGHLEGLGRGRLDGVREIGVLLGRAVDRPEARAPLLHEPGGGDGVPHPQGLEDLVAPGKLGLSDVEAGELLALEEQDPATPAGEEVATLEPPGPPPTTATSKSHSPGEATRSGCTRNVTAQESYGLQREDRLLVLASAQATVGEDAVLGDPPDGLVEDLLCVGLEHEALTGSQRRVSMRGWKRTGNSFR